MVFHSDPGHGRMIVLLHDFDRYLISGTPKFMDRLYNNREATKAIHGVNPSSRLAATIRTACDWFQVGPVCQPVEVVLVEPEDMDHPLKNSMSLEDALNPVVESLQPLRLEPRGTNGATLRNAPKFGGQSPREGHEYTAYRPYKNHQSTGGEACSAYARKFKDENLLQRRYKPRYQPRVLSSDEKSPDAHSASRVPPPSEHLDYSRSSHNKMFDSLKAACR
ncbi:hypothetical protein F4810DRAFT_716129 [Camillea tinctor]|nr:hypothetical protein F4810DRAFT_716129 [Camillea tinctor]